LIRRQNVKRMLLTIAVILSVTFCTASMGWAQANAGHLAGSWKGTVTGTIPPGIGAFTDLITFSTEGTVIESRRPLALTPFGRLLESAGHGAWTRTGNGQFEVHFIFILQNAETGDEVGTDNILLRLNLDPRGQHLTGTFTSVVEDTSGNVLFIASGTYDAVPIQ
jgi:hypothetical protein